MDKIDSNHMHLTSFFGPDPNEYPLPPARPQRGGGSRCQLYIFIQIDSNDPDAW